MSSNEQDAAPEPAATISPTTEARGRNEDQGFTTWTTAAAERPTPTKETSLTPQEEFGFKFECLKNVAYHEHCERVWARRHRWLMFLVILAGTAAFGSAVRDSAVSDWLEAKWLSLATAVLGALDLVFNVSGRARKHASLRRRYGDLLAEFVGGAISLRAGQQSIFRIYAEEPTQFCAVTAMAYNAAMRQMGRSEGGLLHVPPLRRWSCMWFASPGYDFMTKEELRGRWMRYRPW